MDNQIKILSKVDCLKCRKYFYMKDGEEVLHHEHEPAITFPNGTKYYMSHGKWHRANGAAIEYHNGEKCWCWHGQVLKDITSQNEFEKWLSNKDSSVIEPKKSFGHKMFEWLYTMFNA